MSLEFKLKTTHSKDGTKIAYYQIGTGPGVIILHGGMQHALSHADLTTSLAGHFTCYLPDRRGRGQSGTPSKHCAYTPQKEVEDVEAIHAASGAKFIFGVSSGALLTLKAALAAPPSHIAKIAVFEPPWWPEEDRDGQMAWVARYEAEVEGGELASAAVTAMLGAQMGPPIMQSKYFPRTILVGLTKMMMRFDRPVGMPTNSNGGTNTAVDQQGLSFGDLVPTFRNDIKIALDMLGEKNLQTLSAIQTQSLVLGGTRSPEYLQRSVRELDKILPNSRLVQLEGIDHGGTFNKAQRGSPEVFAQELRRFFSEGNDVQTPEGD
jgi:pimeloyl-ACP methyl ester carboxylesterase